MALEHYKLGDVATDKKNDKLPIDAHAAVLITNCADVMILH